MNESLRLGLLTLIDDAAPLPWRAGDPQDPRTAGAIYAADGHLVLRVYREGSMPAQGNLAQAIVLALNSATGFDTPSSPAP